MIFGDEAVKGFFIDDSAILFDTLVLILSLLALAFHFILIVREDVFQSALFEQLHLAFAVAGVKEMHVHDV